MNKATKATKQQRKIAHAASQYLRDAGRIGSKAIRAERIRVNGMHRSESGSAYIDELDDCGVCDPYVYE